MEEIIKSIQNHMIRIEGGRMKIGDLNNLYKPNSLWHAIKNPSIGKTIVQVSDFSISDHPVTESEWAAVMGGDSSSQLPKVRVSWIEAIQFIQRLNRLTGRQYRLPTEAEWEFAARGGKKNRVDYLFSGDHILMQVGWNETTSGGHIHNVKELLPNKLGLYDMSGNVWEWCSDWYAKEYETGTWHLFEDNDPVLDPQGPPIGEKRVLRGGSYCSEEKHCWVFWRYKEKPEKSFSNVGFRLALN